MSINLSMSFNYCIQCRQNSQSMLITNIRGSTRIKHSPCTRNTITSPFSSRSSTTVITSWVIKPIMTEAHISTVSTVDYPIYDKPGPVAHFCRSAASPQTLCPIDGVFAVYTKGVSASESPATVHRGKARLSWTMACYKKKNLVSKTTTAL